jgi:hypothetical protein
LVSIGRISVRRKAGKNLSLVPSGVANVGGGFGNRDLRHNKLFCRGTPTDLYSHILRQYIKTAEIASKLTPKY